MSNRSKKPHQRSSTSLVPSFNYIRLKQRSINSSSRHSQDLNDGSNYNRIDLKSITEQNSLDTFLTVAELAEKDFNQDHKNITLITKAAKTEDLSVEEKKKIYEEERNVVTFPKRPFYLSPGTLNTMPREKLIEKENEEFLIWRRNLAKFEEKTTLTLTPFEKNLEVWRQFWRVVEKSNVVIQILDARNPLLYFNKDLQKYVGDVAINQPKDSLVILNKADLLTDDQRRKWNDYFQSKGIKSVFFSACQEESEKDRTECESRDPFRILSREELIDYFKTFSESLGHSGTLMVGFVGYPNVGKSSTINTLLRAKKVSTSATPGKTKHFQTFFLDKDLCICDCPGLVFPNFVSSKAEMILSGILPIDQMKDHVPAVKLLISLIPNHVFETTYGIVLPPEPEDTKERSLTDQQLLNAYGYMRGYMTPRGLPDNARSARYILKDFVDGKLLYCIAPPGIDQAEYHKFSHKTRARPAHIPLKQQNLIKSDTVTAQEFNDRYFQQISSSAHSRGIHGVSGYTRKSDYVHHSSNLTDSTQELSKPWRAQSKRNKKQKLRKAFAHLDVK